ncbi:MAG: bifunctional nuclease family protein [Bacteroidota bacterium]
MEKVQVDILGLSTSPASNGAYALILKEVNGDRRLPIIIGAFEAQSIALEMEGIKPPRPLTHDLMKNIIDQMGASLTEILINDLRDGTFFAQLELDSSTINHEVDSRPSDAIALAVRYGVPIFVAETVMQEASFLPDQEAEEEKKPAEKHPPKKLVPKVTRLEQLRNELKEAIEKEDYERAAKFRDEIRRLESGD